MKILRSLAIAALLLPLAACDDEGPNPVVEPPGGLDKKDLDEFFNLRAELRVASNTSDDIQATVQAIFLFSLVSIATYGHSPETIEGPPQFHPQAPRATLRLDHCDSRAPPALPRAA